MPSVRLCLTGDVMSGRGIDQILGHPGDPAIHESWMRPALDYVELAEARAGPVPRRVPPTYVWGDLLPLLRHGSDALVVNLETAVTDRGRPWPGKGIQYRMHPANVTCLSVAGIDVAVLANNHMLDWSLPGLEQTLDCLHDAGIATVGAGRSDDEAWAPAAVELPSRLRVLVVAAGSPSSGIPWDWAATRDRPGLALLSDLTDATADRIAAVVRASARPGDLVVTSLHWGGNWGCPIPGHHRRFARRLVEDAGVHVVHGHSSHHPLGIEVHCGRLILYGCGDLLTDCEGVQGHEQHRGELGALYLPTIDAASGDLRQLELVPTKVERFRLTHPPEEDVRWLVGTLDREGAALGTRVSVADGGRLAVSW